MTEICGFDRFDNIRTNAQLSNEITLTSRNLPLKIVVYRFYYKSQVPQYK